MPIKVPKGYTSPDVENRQPLGWKSPVEWEHEVDKAETEGYATRHSTTNEEYMKNLDIGTLKTQQLNMRLKAHEEMGIQEEHDAARARRQAKTRKEYKGVR